LCQLLGHDAVIGISQQLSKNNREYYSQLEATSSYTVDISDWIEWFGKSLIQSTIDVKEKISLAILQSEWWSSHKHLKLNDRHVKVIRKLFQFGPHGMEGGMTAKKYMGITRTSKATATRDLAYLHQIGVLKKNESGGRSTNYSLKVFGPDTKKSPQVIRTDVPNH
jgi:Fic family protein